MADSVVKLRIDSKEYDANIKRAGQALTDYFNKVKEGGGTLKYLDDGVLEAVQAMGELGTMSGNTKGALRELTVATTDMTAAYRALTDEEKASPIGAAMAKSIAEMTERAGNMKDAMGDVAASISNAASDTRGFDQAAQGIQLMTSGLQTAVGAAKLLGIEMGNEEQVLATLASAMSITNGLQTAQNLLQKQSALMMGVQSAQAVIATAAQTALAAATGSATLAQKAFNVVANMNPYVALATAVAAVGTALYAFSSASAKAKKEEEELTKAAEEAAKKADEQCTTFVNASAEAMNAASRISSLQVAYKNANTEMEKTNILKQAQTEFKKLGLECKGLNDALNLLITNGSKVIELIQLQGNVAAVSAVRMEAFKNSFKMLMENGYSASAAASLAGYNKEVVELDGQITQMQGRIQILRGSLPTKGGKTTVPVTEEQQNAARIAELVKLYQDLATAAKTADDAQKARLTERMAKIQGEINALQDRNTELKKFADEARQVQYPVGSLPQLNEQLKTLQTEQAKALDAKQWQEYQQQIDAVSDRISILKGELPKGKEVVFTVTAETSEAIDKLRGIEDVRIDHKGVTVTADTSEALKQVQQVIADTEGMEASVMLKVIPQFPDIDELFPDLSEQNYNTGYAGSDKARQQSLLGDWGMSREAFGAGPLNMNSIETFISETKSLLQQADFGSDLYTSLTEQLRDATTMSTLLQELMERGLAGADLESIAQALKDKLLSPEGIDQTTVQTWLEQLNNHIEEAGGVGLTLNANTGAVEDKKAEKQDKSFEDFTKGLNTVSSGLSSVTSGMKSLGIEIPKEIDSAINVMNAVGQIISGVQAIISLTQTPTQVANTTAIGLNTAAIGGLIAALEVNTAASFIPFANGGIVPKFANGGLIGKAAGGMLIPGMSYSGDNLRMPITGGRGMIGVNSGELILNESSQNNIASGLMAAESLIHSMRQGGSLDSHQQEILMHETEGSVFKDLQLSTEISAEDILIVLNDRLSRQGNGEVVTSKSFF